MIGTLKRFVGRRTASRLTDGMHRVGLVLAAPFAALAIIGMTFGIGLAAYAPFAPRPTAIELRDNDDVCKPDPYRRIAEPRHPADLFRCTDAAIAQRHSEAERARIWGIVGLIIGLWAIAALAYGACRLFAWIINGFRGR